MDLVDEMLVLEFIVLYRSGTITEIITWLQNYVLFFPKRKTQYKMKVLIKSIQQFRIQL